MTDPTVQAIRKRLEKIAPFPWRVVEEESAIDVRLNTFAICDAKERSVAVKIATRELAEWLTQQAAEGQALREVAEFEQAEAMKYHGLYEQIEGELEALREERDGLLTKIAAGVNEQFATLREWVARTEAAEAALAQLHAAQARLIAQWREEAAFGRDGLRALGSVPISYAHASATILRTERCADELEKALGLLGSAVPEDAPR